jgi:hypothetical protein
MLLTKEGDKEVLVDDELNGELAGRVRISTPLLTTAFSDRLTVIQRPETRLIS